MNFHNYVEKVLKNCEQIGLQQLTVHYKPEDIHKEISAAIFMLWKIGDNPEKCAKILYEVFEEIHIKKMNQYTLES